MSKATALRTTLAAAVTAVSLGTAGTVHAEQDTLRIGALVTLSGAGAAWGNGMYHAAQLAAADVNADGGLKVGGKRYQVEVVAYDDKYQADAAVTAANRLVYEDNIKYVIGTVGSAPILAIQPLTEKNGVITMTLAFTAEALSPEKKYTFRPNITTGEMAQPQIDWIVQEKGLKKVGGLFPNDETGQQIAEDVAAAYERAGADLSNVEFFERERVDFIPLLTRILGSGVDAIELDGNSPTTAGLILKQARELGFEGTIVRTGGPATPQIVKVAGKQAAEGLYVHTPIDVTQDEVASYQQRFESTYDKDMNGFSPFFYDGTHMLFEAMRRAGTVEDTSQVAEVLEGIEGFDGILGKLSWTGEQKYGIAHQIDAPFYIARVEDGKERIVARCNVEACE